MVWSLCWVIMDAELWCLPQEQVTSQVWKYIAVVASRDEGEGRWRWLLQGLVNILLVTSAMVSHGSKMLVVFLQYPYLYPGVTQTHTHRHIPTDFAANPQSTTTHTQCTRQLMSGM